LKSNSVSYKIVVANSQATIIDTNTGQPQIKAIQIIMEATQEDVALILSEKKFTLNTMRIGTAQGMVSCAVENLILILEDVE
jgi:hypothetical protein